MSDSKPVNVEEKRASLRDFHEFANEDDSFATWISPDDVTAMLDEIVMLREKLKQSRLFNPPIANGTRVRMLIDLHFNVTDFAPKGTEGIIEDGFPQNYNNDGSVDQFGYNMVTDDGRDIPVCDGEIEVIPHQIESLRARIAELEAERGVITYVAVNTNPHPETLKYVLNDALRDVRRKLQE